MLIIFTTVADPAEAETLADRLVSEKLAACVQILPPMTSVYFWEGEVQKDQEHLLMIKTLSEKFGEVEAFLNKEHTYDVPEIVALKPESVSADYSSWLTGYING